MPVTTPPSITALPAAPDPANRGTFNTLAYPWSAALPTFGTQVSAVASNVFSNATDAATSATTASTARDEALQAQAAAEAASSAVQWVSGTTYAIGDVVWSPVDFASYRRKTAGAGTTDPSADATNWQALAGSGGAGLTRSARTSNTILGTADKGKLIDITSGTFTQTFSACATLADGWWCYIRNSGTGNVTLDPNGSELIDGVTSGLLKSGMTVLLQCDGLALSVIRIGEPMSQEVLLSGTTWTCPIGVRAAEFTAVGGGGGPETSNGGCGGGGGVSIKTMPVSPGTAYTYAVGSAGVSAFSGGNTTITIGGTTITANGGASGFPGAGGTASGGDINVTGKRGVSSTAGGDSLLGFGGTVSGLTPASGYGAGGIYQGGSVAATQGVLIIKY